jgi:hypothetical protein
MEKTKHLSMTTEEKLAKEKEELSLAIKGLVQKHQDRIVSTEIFQKEMRGLQKRYALEDSDILLSEILGRLDLQSDNDLLFKLIKDVLQMDTIIIEELLNQYRNQIKQLFENKAERIKKELDETYNISGSAIIPNIAADSSFQKEVEDIQDQFYLKLDKMKGELLDS